MNNPSIISNPAKYQQGWTGGLPETPCGFGSRVAQTKAQRRWIPQLIRRYGIATVADIGAGDLNWLRHLHFPAGTHYTAYDLVPRHRSIKSFNLLIDVCPQVDLLLCLWVLNHFPVAMMRLGIDNLLASGSKYLLMTWDNRLPGFLDVPYIAQLQIRGAQNFGANPHGGMFMRLVKCK